MEESHYHHHHHHHHHHHDHDHQTTQPESEQTQSATAPVLVPRPNEQTTNGVQATSSFHSVSSIDSSAEMSKYFPDAQTPSLSPFRHHQEDDQQTQSAVTTTTAVTNTNTVNSGPYITVPVPTAGQQQQQFPQPARAPVTVPPPQQQQQVRLPAASQLPSGIPSYSSQIEGLGVAQTVVNDVLIDLQSKVINETQQQYYGDSSSGSYFEPLSPIYIRAPNPTIILRSDLHRLRAQLTAKPPAVARYPGGTNQFQQPSFPPPQQHLSSESYG